MDQAALEQVGERRSPATKLGWAVQWGTVRMLGVFLTEDPTAVPAGAVEFVAGQIGVGAGAFAEYGRRGQTVYEHSWQIRELLGYRDFAEAEAEVRRHVAARAWSTTDGPRALFDRAVVYMLKERVLLPGITVLTRLVGEVRRQENLRLFDLLAERTQPRPPWRCERCYRSRRTGGCRSWSGCGELDRVSEIAGLGTGRVEVDPAPAVKLAALARYGMASKARTTYGPLDRMSRHTVRLDRIRAHWADMLRVAGSLSTGQVRAYDLIRMLSRDGRPTGLGDAFAHYGRIFKTLHLLQFISDDGYRRMIGTQLSTQEARHRLARRIAFGNRGQLRQRYREGMEDQLGALGLALNAVVWWNTLYLDAAVKQIRADGFPTTDDMCARISPIAYEHINFLGRYAFTRADASSGLRPFHAPAAEG
ncbi:Tn3 family transposase [Actinomadura kijaniata]|uniref:Tn3 family transposase n=1 Tax=Actinomadura kijaniata TaxID=46161 RepID=UPI003F1C341B